MHKCIGHHQKAIAKARDRPDTTDPSYLNEWKLLFTMVNALWKHRGSLGEEKFVRIHRSIIVNLDRIHEMHPHFNGDYVVVLQDGVQLKLSRSRREHLEARLKGAS